MSVDPDRFAIAILGLFETAERHEQHRDVGVGGGLGFAERDLLVVARHRLAVAPEPRALEAVTIPTRT